MGQALDYEGGGSSGVGFPPEQKPDRLKNWLAGQFSLDSPKQDFFSAETAGDAAIGLIPGATLPMAARDFERARRDDDPIGMGLSVASALPLGNLIGKLRDPVRKIFAGEKAWKAPTQALDRAKVLENQVNPRETWNETGWFRGDEGHEPWKWEIADAPAKIIPDTGKKAKSGITYYGGNEAQKVLDHPELYNNYPDLAEMTVSASHGPGRSVGGQFDPLRREIAVHGSDEEEMRKILLHELQHVVQEKEGFASGTGTDTIKYHLRNARTKYGDPAAGIDHYAEDEFAKKHYNNNLGEVESTLVENRANLSPEELKKQYPISGIRAGGETYDSRETAQGIVERTMKGYPPALKDEMIERLRYKLEHGLP